MVGALSLAVLVGGLVGGVVGASPSLAAAADHPSPEQREKIREEMRKRAVEACETKNKGQRCSITTPRGKLDGRCRAHEGELVCRPDERPDSLPPKPKK